MKGDNYMANLDTVGRQRTVEITAFGSLDRQAPACGGSQAWVLRNLRPMADGSLLRREGYVPMLSLDGEVRGVFFTERDGVTEGYAVAGETVYSLRETDGVYGASAIGTLTTQGGGVSFLTYDGCVILMDGAAVYDLKVDGMTPLRAYVPLYGKDWLPDKSADRSTFEKPNLLTRQLRLRYADPNNQISLIHMDDLPVESVDGILADGEPISTWNYNKRDNRIGITLYRPIGTVFDVFVTVSPDFFAVPTSNPLSAEGTAMIGDAEAPRLIFFGGGLPTGQLWMSRVVDREERAAVRAMYPEACALYITNEDSLTVGDGVQAITGACRHYDRSLVFTTDQAWMADGSVNDGGKLRLIPVNGTLGCDRGQACAVIGNHPYTLHRGRVLRWNSHTDERNECNAEVVSVALGNLIGKVGGRLFADGTGRELWLYTPHQAGALVMQESGGWTAFDGFTPSGMFMLDHAVGFYSGHSLYRFDPNAGCDVDEAGSAHGIVAEYQSRYMDLDGAERLKRLCCVSVVAECGDQAVELSVQDVRGRISRSVLRGTGDEVCVLSSRAHTGRFRFLRVGVLADGEGRLRLCGLRLTAR